MHEDDDVEVRRHWRKRPGMTAGEMAARRHDRASRQAVHPYTAASAPAIREALGEDWRGPKAQQDSWSSAAHMDPPRDDRRPAHDPFRPLDITDHRCVTQRTAAEPGEPVFGSASLGASGAVSAAWRAPG
jgi:hypothetical protein